MKRSQEINDFIFALTGIDNPETIQLKKCVFCKDPDFNFRDDLSRKEYEISALCQKCQDDFYKEPEEEE